MTYKVCKRLIKNKDFNEAKKADIQMKLDIFLLNNRITQEEYEELTGMLNEK